MRPRRALAAEEQNLWGIGVDADQAYLGATSSRARSRGSTSPCSRRSRSEDGAFSGGADTVFDVASGGVGIGEIAPDVPAELVSRVHAMEDAIAAGEITSIPETVR